MAKNGFDKNGSERPSKADASAETEDQRKVFEKIRQGLKSLGKGRGIPHEEVRKQFGLRGKS